MKNINIMLSGQLKAHPFTYVFYCIADMDLGYVKRRTWSTPEKHTMHTIFKNYIKNQKIPSTEECLDVINQYPDLKGRSVPQIKLWIVNYIKRSKTEGNVTIDTQKDLYIKFAMVIVMNTILLTTKICTKK